MYTKIKLQKFRLNEENPKPYIWDDGAGANSKLIQNILIKSSQCVRGFDLYIKR